MSNDSKTLILDIETRPAIAYVWRTFKENISPEQVIDPGGMICFAAKWQDKGDIYFYSDWTHSKGEMVRAIHELMSEADAVVTYNGDKFDLPKLNGEFILEGLLAPPPVTSIDVLKTVRKLGLLMNRLAFVGPLLKVGEKIKTEGFALWTSVIDGDPTAQKKMMEYNIQDVVLLEKLYKKIRPFIRNHPHLGAEAHSCGACGSNKVQKRGFRRTKAYKIQRLQCTECGSWQDGQRTKVGGKVAA